MPPVPDHRRSDRPARHHSSLRGPRVRHVVHDHRTGPHTAAAALRSVDHRGGLDAFLTKAKDDELSARALKIKRELAKA